MGHPKWTFSCLEGMVVAAIMWRLTVTGSLKCLLKGENTIAVLFEIANRTGRPNDSMELNNVR
jgi:hypothetical protein